MAENSYSLLELNEYIKRVISLNLSETVWVRCEISQANTTRGHVYLQLVEKQEDDIVAKSQGIIWSSTYLRLQKTLKENLNKLLQDGMEVLLLVKVDFHEVYGLKLIVSDIDPTYSLGKMELKKQEVIAKLRSLQLMDLNSRIPLPIVVQRIAVLSSERAAGLKDFMAHLHNNQYGYIFKPELFSTAVQGQFVETEMLNQFDRIEERSAEFDAVVIIRGGGAKLDLVAFDAFDLSKRIAEFPIPVLTGIGHEIDLSVADMVAHTSFKTPTAVAGFLIDLMITFESGINTLKQRVDLASNNFIHRENLKLSNLTAQIKLRLDQFMLQNHQQLEQLKASIPSLVTQIIKNESNKISNLENLVHQLDPSNLLKKGYSITSMNGEVVRDVKAVKLGDTIVTKFYKGQITSNINDIKNE